MNARANGTSVWTSIAGGILALFAVNALAIPVTHVFTGQLSNVRGKIDFETGIGDGFGYGFAVAEHLHGTFVYDADDGTPLSLAARIGGHSLIAHNLTLDAHLFDGLTWFYIMGQLDNGLFMSFGLTNGFPVFTELYPTVLSTDDWFVRAFKISMNDSIPIETGACEIESICGGRLAVTPVTEPPMTSAFTVALLAVLLVGAGRVLRRVLPSISKTF